MSASNHDEISNDHESAASGLKKSMVNNVKKDDTQAVDDFGLPIRPASRQRPQQEDSDSSDGEDTFHDARDRTVKSPTKSTTGAETPNITEKLQDEETPTTNTSQSPAMDKEDHKEVLVEPLDKSKADQESAKSAPVEKSEPEQANGATNTVTEPAADTKSISPAKKGHERNKSSIANLVIKKEKHASSGPTVSEWSHQQLAPKTQESDEEEEVEWQAMPAIDEFDVFDDDGRLVAKGLKEEEENSKNPYAQYTGFGKGYTRVLDDDDAKSATSMDEDTNYLFKKQQTSRDLDEEAENDPYGPDDADPVDASTQLETTKDLLTEGQRIAYVAVVRLTIFRMINAMKDMEGSRATRKDVAKSLENMGMWGQQIMVRLYKHMDIDQAEQVMIEQLAEHGLEATDLVPPLMQNAKVKNPLADEKQKEIEDSPERPSSNRSSLSQASTKAEPAPKEPVKGESDGEVPEVHGPEHMPTTPKIELDIRWTVLCDMFLVLLEGGVYDSRSRRLLERVASALLITWVQVCRFEKRITDQLEMQETGREDWDESDHIEDRRKQGLKRKYMVMGLATVGGGLVIGLSAGLLAPVIGAGLAAGFTTIGVTGTAGFLGGVGGAALITSAATAAGGTIAVRASHRRTGHVQTFEYRPLHSNKRLNLILTVSGWMTGNVDDVRLPFSTVDPIMGDIYSLLWEPEMLKSMGDTINILATEALTQTVQQVLGSTILVALMASLQLPIVLTKLSYLIDNPWTVSLDRANSAGLILADSLMARHLGHRPITLVGYSLGSRVIFSCLKELASRGAYGIIQNVYLFGSPIVVKKDEYLRARMVIAGRFVNGYASNDWILGYLFRATSGGIMRVAGLASVDNVPGLENVDVTDLVNGHMAYRSAMPRLLKRMKWEVESEDFTEIEDPDPENHAKRQRELIREIDEARKEKEKDEKAGRKYLGLFKRGKALEKKGWETYEVKKSSPRIGTASQSPDANANILFDIDAIRKELLSEQIEVRELDSTQPPMQFTTIQNGEKTTEYLRLPPGIKPEEVSKMKLPPRPAELEEGPLPISNSVSREQSVHSVSRTTMEEPADISLDQPKELVSTLPPLKVSSARPSTSDQPPLRPNLIKHQTDPVGLGVGGAGLTPMALAPELENNAWADGQNQEVKMTFE